MGSRFKFTKNLTILVPTKNRHFHLKILLNYYSNFKFKGSIIKYLLYYTFNVLKLSKSDTIKSNSLGVVIYSKRIV